MITIGNKLAPGDHEFRLKIFICKLSLARCPCVITKFLKNYSKIGTVIWEISRECGKILFGVGFYWILRSLMQILLLNKYRISSKIFKVKFKEFNFPIPKPTSNLYDLDAYI